jgi:chromatin remodeling complex protein RSC6
MVRTSKSTDKQSSAPVAPAPVVESVVSEQSTPVKKSKRTKAVAVEPEVVAPLPVVQDAGAALVLDSADVAESELTMSAKLNVFGAKLQQIAGLLSTVKTEFKVLEKTVSRELKNAQKSSNRKKKSSVSRQPSGFVKPTRISDELAAFLGKTIGTEMARTVVSKEINAYIRENKLQDPANGRRIHPDTKLTTLLKLIPSDELTYFNLQRYMKHHFVKDVPAVAPLAV